MKRKAEGEIDDRATKLFALRARFTNAIDASTTPLNFFIQQKLDSYRYNVNNLTGPFKEDYKKLEHDALMDDIVNWFQTNTGLEVKRGVGMAELSKELDDYEDFDAQRVIDALYQDFVEIQDAEGNYTIDGANAFRGESYLAENKVAVDDFGETFIPKLGYIPADERKSFLNAAEKMREAVGAAKITQNDLARGQGRTIRDIMRPVSVKEAFGWGTTFDNQTNDELQRVREDMETMDNE